MNGKPSIYVVIGHTYGEHVTFLQRLEPYEYVYRDGALYCPDDLEGISKIHKEDSFAVCALSFYVESDDVFKAGGITARLEENFPGNVVHIEGKDKVGVEFNNIEISNSKDPRIMVYIFAQQLNEIIGHNVFNVVDHEISQLIEGNNPHSDLPHWTKKVTEGKVLDLSVVR